MSILYAPTSVHHTPPCFGPPQRTSPHWDWVGPPCGSAHRHPPRMPSTVHLCEGTLYLSGMVLPLPLGCWGVGDSLWPSIPAGGLAALVVVNPGWGVAVLSGCRSRHSGGAPTPHPPATLCEGTLHLPGMVLPLPLGCWGVSDSLWPSIPAGGLAALVVVNPGWGVNGS